MPPSSPRSATGSRLLLAGAVLAPLFYLVVLFQSALKPGFNLSRVPLSLLSIGDAGWVQILNFEVGGLLALLMAGGVRLALIRRRGGVAVPLFIALFGVGLILAGIFHPDPQYGYPLNVNAPNDLPPHPTTGGNLHQAAFGVVQIALAVTCFLLIPVFLSQGRRLWAVGSAIVGAFIPVMIAIIFSTDLTGLVIVVGMVGFFWLSMVAVRLRADSGGSAKASGDQRAASALRGVVG